MDDKLINADQLAALIGVDKRTIFRWKAAGHLPQYDFQQGQTRRWKLSTVRMLIAQPHSLRRAS
jgi:phage terminase Nu1 subunit (DNA packaging protein)